MGYRSLIISVVLLILFSGASVWLMLDGMWGLSVAALLAVAFLVYRIVSIYTGNLRKLNYLLGAFENGDLAFHFVENSSFLQDRVFNILLNKVREFVAGQHRLRNENEAFHNAVENLVRTGILGVRPNGEVRCWNKALATVTGSHVVRHISDLDRVLPGLADRLESLGDEGRIELPIASEMRVHYFEVSCVRVMDGTEPVRIYIFEERVDSRSEAECQESVQWQKMTRIISHEVLNTITPIVSLSDTLMDMTDDKRVREGIDVIGQSARGLLGFVNGYRALSRVPVPKIHPFRFKTMLDYVMSPLLPDLEGMGGRMEVSLEEEDMVLFADEQLMRQVFSNILKNAMNALRDRFQSSLDPADSQAEVPLICVRAFVNASDNTEIHVSNNGVPIPDENAGHIFDPFFTTRAEGTGVGLALSRQIMRAHSGTIRLDRSDPSLTTFVLTL